MSVGGLNHLTFATSDLDRSVAFYLETLGCHLRARWTTGAYLEMGDVWLCLSLDPVARREPHPDYSHVAVSAAPEAFEALRDRITRTARIWKDNRSEGTSIYFLDPDGHKLELHMGTLETRLAAMRESPPAGFVTFD